MFTIALHKWQAAWLACLVDSEGSIFISKVQERRVRRGYVLHPCLSISNTNRDILLQARDFCSVGWLSPTEDKRKIGKNGFRMKDRWQLTMNADAIRKILPQITLFLIVKRHQAELMLRFLALRQKQDVIDLAIVRDLYAKGLTQGQIAHKLSCSQSAVSDWLSQTNKPTKNKNFVGEYPPELLAIYIEIKTLNAKGQPDIAPRIETQ